MKQLYITMLTIILLAFATTAFAQETPVPLETPPPTVASEPAATPEPTPLPPQPGDDNALQAGLFWLIGGGGAGVVAFALLGKSNWFDGLDFEYKRYVSLGFAAFLAVVAFLAASGLGYVDAPVTAQGWLEKLTSVAYATTATAMAVHGFKKARA